MDRAADGVRDPSVVRVSGISVPVAGEPQMGDEVHVACRVIGLRTDPDGTRVAVLEPTEVVG